MEERIDCIFYQELGKQLILRKQKLGYSYRYLSKLTGISAPQLDDCFNGKYRIKRDNYKVLSKALGISPKIRVQVEIDV